MINLIINKAHFSKKIWNFPLPLATRIVKERKKRCMILRGKQKKEVYDFERKTNGSTAALMSGKKKIVEKKLGFWEILDFR